MDEAPAAELAASDVDVFLDNLINPDFAPTTLALSQALTLAIILIPVSALLFAALNLKSRSDNRVLFITATISAALTSLMMLTAFLAPRWVPDVLRVSDMLGFTIVFLYAWTLLDFWRGARRSGLRPRWAGCAVLLSIIATPSLFLAMALTI